MTRLARRTSAVTLKWMPITPLVSTESSSARIGALDMFRGYTVLGMFVVNFLGGFACVPAALKHNDTYFSLADVIMPAFLFVAGVSYRIAWLKREAAEGRRAARSRFLGRSLALVFLSVVLSGLGEGADSWNELVWLGPREFLAGFLKASLWEVLAIIGVCQILLLPLMHRPSWVRGAAIAVFCVTHLLLSASFNVHFVLGAPNWFDTIWGAGGVIAWDGGLFGVLMWAVPMLAGTLAWDAGGAGESPHRAEAVGAEWNARRATQRVVVWSFCAVIAGYGLSCLSIFFDRPPVHDPERHVADSPVWPPKQPWRELSFRERFAPLPCVPPPPLAIRPWNYWMMSKRLTSLPFVLFATGVAGFLFSAFLRGAGKVTYLCHFGEFLGKNALLAFIVHHIVAEGVLDVVPDDAPCWYCLTGLAVFLMATFVVVRYCDRRGWQLRL